MRSRTLGYLFLAPAAVFAVALFLIPVVLTAVFAFTNMSTATGIWGGAYMVNPATLRQLRTTYDLPDLADALEAQSYTVTQATIDALDIPPALARDLADLDGRTFSSRRDLARAIRDLPTRPRATREVNALAEAFEQSVLGNRYDTRDAFLTAVDGMGVALDPAAQDALARAAYTGWVWTTGNFERMWNLPQTWRVLGNTLFYVVATLALFNVGFALVLAITTHYLPRRQASFFQSVWLLPRILPPVLYVLMWKWLAWDTGFLNTVLEPLGVPRINWMLHTEVHAWTFVILINGFVGASMGMLIFAGAIHAIPMQQFYASEVDGASRWQQIRFIILPQLRWPILFITAYQTLSLLASFDLILLSTDGGPGGTTEVWSLWAFHTALNNYAGNLAYGYGAALALVLVVIGIVASIGYLFLFDFRTLVRPPRIEDRAPARARHRSASANPGPASGSIPAATPASRAPRDGRPPQPDPAPRVGE